MAITWGSAVSDSSNAFRIGYEFSQSPSSVANGTTSVTVTLKIYLQTQYYAYDSGVNWAISGNISSSGTTSFNHTSSTSWSSSNITLLATKTRTVTPSFSGTVATSITATVNSLAAIAGTASVSGTWTTAKRPIIAPDAPNGLTLTRLSDSQTRLDWNNNSPTDAAAPYTNMEVERYDTATGVYTDVTTSLGVVETYTASGQSADKRYYYRVRAVNSAGASGWSTAGPIYTTPDAPTAVTAVKAGTTSINISWTTNDGYCDQYEVWHRTNGVRDGSVYATVGNVTFYAATGLSTTTAHSWEIRAKVSSGTGALLSAYSSPSNAITLTNLDPNAVSSVTPATSTITTPNPSLGLTMSAIGTGQTQKGQWEFATDTGFTANVKTVTEADADLRASGATTEAPNLATLSLTNGTWYMRARAVDVNGTPGPWSATATLTVNTPLPPTPTAVLPAAASTVTTMYPTLSATIGADSAGRTTKAEWTLATDSGFTTGVRTITEPDIELAGASVHTELLTEAFKIYGNGTWYVRARSVAQDGAVSSWSGTQSFTLTMAAPPTPTALLPVDLATVTTDFPILSLTLGEASEGRRSKAKWELATNSGFSTNLKTVTEGDGDLRLLGVTTEPVPTGSALFQGVWYIRGAAVDEYGQASAWTSTQSFTVTHKPSATPTFPINDTTSVWATTSFTWTFSDPEPTDTQTAFQLIIERNDTGAVLYDSTKTVTSAKVSAITTAGLVKDIKLRWKIRVWDSDDVASNYSAYQLFTLSDFPVVTITAPTEAAEMTTGQPTITWTTDGATTQASYRVVIKRTSDGVTILDSNTVSTSVKTYTAPGTVLENSVNYNVTVTVTDTAGMQGSDTNNFTTVYQSPDTVLYIVNGGTYEDQGYIDIDWSQMQADDFFVQWNVYRRKTGEMEWTRLVEYVNPGITGYHDWTATAGDTWEYAVTQHAGRSGVILESVINPTPDSIIAEGTHYWLINPNDESNNLKIDHVKADSFTDDYDEAALIVIGRGRKVNQGTRYGYSGTLTAQLRDSEFETARSKRQRLQQIKSALTSYYLRNPFGDIFVVALSNMSFDRIAGVSTAEYVDVSIPYMEVF